MNAETNPFRPPKNLVDLIPAHASRNMNVSVVAAVGFAVGALSFMVAIALVPESVTSRGKHDLALANILGFFYPPLVGLWAAWIRRSIPWALLGVLTGLGIGFIYYLLCDYNFNAVMIGFPCFLGGVTSVLLGLKHSEWQHGIPQRFLKGIVTGFVLGITYTVLLNVLLFVLLPNPKPTLTEYISTMWRAGPIAMGIASSLYFILFQWSAGISSKPPSAALPLRGKRSPAAMV
jgi:hypothetical protein